MKKTAKTTRRRASDSGPRTYRSGDKLEFGRRHLGETIDYVAQFDPTYIDWMHSNGLCDEATVTRRDRGQFKRKRLKDGYAVVF